MKKLLFSKNEVTKMLSVGEDVVNELIDKGKLKTIEIKPGVTRIKASSVKAYLNIQSGNIVNPRKFHLIFWLTAIIAFISQIGLIAVQASEKNYTWSSLVSRLATLNIGLGVIFFLGMLISKDKKYFQKNIPIIYRKTWSLALVYFLVITIPTLVDVYAFQGTNLRKASETITSIPTPTLYQVLPTIKTVNKVNNTQNINNAVVTDMVNCNINAKCGGGTKLMKKSECDSSYCCFLKDGTAKLLSSKSACDNYYSNTTTNQNTNTTNYPPCVVSHPEGGSSTYYNIPPEQCKKDKDTLNSIYNASKPAPTSSYVAPTTNVYQAPTSNQSYVDQCKAICSNTGAGAMRRITELATAMGTINLQSYADDVAKNRDWVTNCQNDCH
jgi:hypothetical protein